MQIRVSFKMASAVGFDKLAPFGVPDRDDYLTWKDGRSVDPYVVNLVPMTDPRRRDSFD